MQDFGPYLDTVGVVALSLCYLWLVWGLTKDWSPRIMLALFVFLPLRMQTVALACVLIWALKDARVARNGKIPTGDSGPSHPTPSAPTGGVRLGPRAI